MEDSLSTSVPKTNKSTKQPTPYSRIILQNLTVAQLFDKLTTLRKKKKKTNFHNPAQINPLQVHPTSLRHILILSLYLRRLPSCAFPSGFSTKTHPSHPYRYDDYDDMWRTAWTMKLFISKLFVHLPFYSSARDQTVLPSSLFRDISDLSPLTSEANFDAHKISKPNCDDFNTHLHAENEKDMILKKNSNICPTRCNVTLFILSGNCSTCFGWYLHPSSGAQTTVSTASGICQTVTATCRYSGR